MSLGVAATILASVCIALGGYLFTFFHERVKSERSAQLARVNQQIQEFYGPLYAMAHGTNRTWQLVEKRYKASDRGSSEASDASWRVWMTEVFFPSQMRMVDLLFDHADLLIDDEIPPAMLKLVAHYQSHAYIQARWRDGRFDEKGALIRYPHQDLLNWSEAEFIRLKTEQRRLLGITRSSTLEPLRV